MATYLVTQATGQQSQWVIRHLLDAGAHVHALVRDPQKPGLPAVLLEPRVTIFGGESHTYDAMFAAAQGCRGAFLNTFPAPGLETAQAETVAAACRAAGVDVLVAATAFVAVGSGGNWDADRAEAAGLRGYFASKAAVEAAVRAFGPRHTILRPAVLHHDFFVPGAAHMFPRLPTDGVLDSVLAPGAALAYTDAHDVGRYAAAAMLAADDVASRFAGREIDLAHEALSLERARDVLARVSGHDRLRVDGGRDFAALEAAGLAVFGQRFQLWANLHDFSGLAAAAAAVQQEFGIPFTSLEASMQRDRARLLESLPAQ